MDSPWNDLFLSEDPSNEDACAPRLDRYKEEIRVKYLEEGHTQSQILEWLNNDQPYLIRSTQLTRQLGKWEYFKNRSYLRPQRIRKNGSQAVLETNMPTRALSFDLPKSPGDLVLDNDNDNGLADPYGAQSIRAARDSVNEIDEVAQGAQQEAEHRSFSEASIRRKPTSPVSSRANEKESRWGFNDPPLAASVTSSQLTGLHSFRSLQRRLQCSTKEGIHAIGDSRSASADANNYYALHFPDDEHIDLVAIRNDFSDMLGHIDDYLHDFLPGFSHSPATSD